jgi:hypothetical protein
MISWRWSFGICTASAVIAYLELGAGLPLYLFIFGAVVAFTLWMEEE